MIWILDDLETHGPIMTRVIKDICASTSEIYNTNPSDIFNLYDILKKFYDVVDKDDLVLIPWAVKADIYLDTLVYNIADKAQIFCSAGNDNSSVLNYSPTRLPNVRVVGCLNKSLKPTQVTNYGRDDMYWVVGTSYDIDQATHSGSSISAAVCVALAHKHKDLNQAIYDYNLSCKL